jgi:Tetratricopeptide repeat
MKNIIWGFLLFLLAVSLPAQETDLYERGKELYRDARYSEAREALETFRARDPQDVKADDALWYLGRVYRELGLTDEAIAAFKTVMADEGSNRRTEALYDLSRTWDMLDREELVLEYAGMLLDSDPADSYINRTIPVVLKSYYLVGLRTRTDRFGAAAREIWLEGLAFSRDVFAAELDEKTRGDILEYRVKYEVKLAETSSTDRERQAALTRAEANLAEYLSTVQDQPETAEKLKADLADARTDRGSFDYSLYAGGGYNGLLDGAGVLTELKLSGALPLGYLTFLEWKLKYQHDPFTRKTFNFPAAETGDERMISSSDDLSATLGLEWGSKYFFRQNLSLTGDLRMAEDAGDDSQGVSLDYDFDLISGNRARIGMDNSLSFSCYPDYVNGSNTIDNYKLAVSPYYRLFLEKESYLKFDYEFYWKSYLDAHYDTASGGTDPDNRQYLSNALSLEWGRDFKSGISTSAGVSTEFLKSLNYDLLVSGNPADRFITDYYDYLENGAYADIAYRNKLLRTQLDGRLAVRNYLNYEARDNTRTFIDEKRLDTSVDLGWKNRLILMDDDQRGRLSLVLDLYLDKALSNHTYEATYATNYTDWGVLIGLEWED